MGNYEVRNMNRNSNDFSACSDLELHELIESKTDLEKSRDIDTAKAVLAEIERRTSISVWQKEYARKRVAALKARITAERNKLNRWPTVDVLATRRRAGSERVPDWTDHGLLSLSGYHVGSTAGVNSRMREAILNYIFLYDDLSDVRDRKYAAEWGQPKSAERLMKLANCLAAFARNALKQESRSYDQAISEWTNDLKYLKTQFYHDWGKFPWPNAKTPEDW